jgi:phosphoglycerate dehydrogenase-like enzyme
MLKASGMSAKKPASVDQAGWKVLFCDHAFAEARSILAALLPDWWVEPCRETELATRLPQAEVAVPLMGRLDRPLIAAGATGRLRMIQQYGVGLEAVDIDAASRFGIYVANVPGALSANSASVAELVIWFMITLVRRLDESRRAFKQGRLGEPPGDLLLGKTAALLGLGQLGRAIAPLLKALGMKVLALRRRPEREDQADEMGLDFLGGPSDLERILAEADFIVVCLPLTPQTRGLIDRRALAAVKPGSFLINVGRGPVVEHQDLLESLAQGRMAGAGLDVFWQEPMSPSDPLFRYNVVATPHIGGLSLTSYRRIGEQVAANLRRLRAGLEPLHCVNLDYIRNPGGRRSVPDDGKAAQQGDKP